MTDPVHMEFAVWQAQQDPRSLSKERQAFEAGYAAGLAAAASDREFEEVANQYRQAREQLKTYEGLDAAIADVLEGLTS